MNRINRYALKRRHKRKIKKKHMLRYSGGADQNLKIFEDRLRRDAEEYADTWWRRKHPPRNGGYEYWGECYLSGRRKFAKKFSDKRIRQKYRQMIRNLDPEDVTAPRGSDYEKEFDYAWTIW